MRKSRVGTSAESPRWAWHVGVVLVIRVGVVFQEKPFTQYESSAV